MQEKVRYVINNGYGGIMIWTLGYDHLNTHGNYDEWSLLPAIGYCATGPVVTHTVTPLAGSNGNILPSAQQTVLTLGDVTFTATPGASSSQVEAAAQPMDTTPSYVVDQWLVNGIPIPTASGATNFTLQNVTADTSVQVTFKPAPSSAYSVTLGTDGNGTISPCDPLSVESSSNVTFTATPYTGYVVDQWLVNDVAQQSGLTSYTLYNVTASATVKVTFKAAPADSYALTTVAVPSYGGTVSEGGAFTAGSQQTVTAAANPGCSFINWTENGIEVCSSNSYSLVLATNRSLVANFTATQVIISDKDAPSLQITQPYSSGSFVTTSSSVNMAGTASDLGHGDNGISSVTVKGVEASGDTAANGGTANWNFPVSLTLGTNLLTVVAMDDAGNTNVQQVTVIYSLPDTTLPQVTLMSPNSGTYSVGSQVALSATASDSSGISYCGYYLFQGGGEVGIIYQGNPGDGLVSSYTWTVPSTLNGYTINGTDYQICFAAWDASANANGNVTLSSGYVTLQPTNDEEPFFVGIDMSTHTNAVLGWCGITNHKCTIYCSTNLLSGFSVLCSNMTATAATNIFTDSIQNCRQKFWRITTDE